MKRFDVITGSLLTWAGFSSSCSSRLAIATEREKRLHSHVKRENLFSQGITDKMKYNTTRQSIYIWITYLLKLAIPALGTPDEPASDCD
jgi:hypothetical protein